MLTSLTDDPNKVAVEVTLAHTGQAQCPCASCTQVFTRKNNDHESAEYEWCKLCGRHIAKHFGGPDWPDSAPFYRCNPRGNPTPTPDPISLDQDSEHSVTFRQLRAWLNEWARAHNDAELDMPVILRVRRDDDTYDDLVLGGLFGVDVDPGCTEKNALVLDASSETGSLDNKIDDGDDEEVDENPDVDAKPDEADGTFDHLSFETEETKP